MLSNTRVLQNCFNICEILGPNSKDTLSVSNISKVKFIKIFILDETVFLSSKVTQCFILSFKKQSRVNKTGSNQATKFLHDTNALAVKTEMTGSKNVQMIQKYFGKCNGR